MLLCIDRKLDGGSWLHLLFIFTEVFCGVGLRF